MGGGEGSCGGDGGQVRSTPGAAWRRRLGSTSSPSGGKARSETANNTTSSPREVGRGREGCRSRTYERSKSAALKGSCVARTNIKFAPVSAEVRQSRARFVIERAFLGTRWRGVWRCAQRSTGESDVGASGDNPYFCAALVVLVLPKSDPLGKDRESLLTLGDCHRRAFSTREKPARVVETRGWLRPTKRRHGSAKNSTQPA